MRVESILASVLIIISLFHPDIPGFLVWLIPAIIGAFAVTFGYIFSMLSSTNEYFRYTHLTIVCIPCLIAGVTDEPIVDLWLRIGGVVSCILFSFLLYNTTDKDCTLEFKNKCFKGVLADVSLIGIIPAALDLYFGWMSVGSGISMCLTILYGGFLVYEPRDKKYSLADLTSNGEQQVLFGINDYDI